MTPAVSKVCVSCKKEKKLEKFKLVKGKYRSGKCHTCLNHSKQTNEERSIGSKNEAMRKARAERAAALSKTTPPLSFQIARTRLFLRLWHSNIPKDVALSRVNEVYPPGSWLREEI